MYACVCLLTGRRTFELSIIFKRLLLFFPFFILGHVCPRTRLCMFVSLWLIVCVCVCMCVQKGNSFWRFIRIIRCMRILWAFNVLSLSLVFVFASFLFLYSIFCFCFGLFFVNCMSCWQIFYLLFYILKIYSLMLN